jgi:ADP-ribosylglycohydrolase
MKASAVDKFKGALLGCAVGDALGAPVEGMTAEAIREKHGRLTDFIDERFGAGRITDDTQMTIVLAHSVLELGKFDKAHAGLKFGRWIAASDDGVKEARGAGMASATASRRLHEGVSPETSGVDSAGCGAAMRVSPIALRYFNDPKALHDAAVDQALLTHTDPRAVAGSAAMAYAVAAGIADEGDLDRGQLAADIAAFILQIDPEFSARVAGLADYLDASPAEGFAYTGTGGIASETVPGALFAFLRSPYDFEESVLTAVNAGGDADSLGAMTGAVSGAFNGMPAIPRAWKDGVEGSEYIESVAYRLYTLTPACERPKRSLW